MLEQKSDKKLLAKIDHAKYLKYTVTLNLINEVRSDKISFDLTKAVILSGRCLTELQSISTALRPDQNFTDPHIIYKM